MPCIVRKGHPFPPFFSACNPNDCATMHTGTDLGQSNELVGFLQVLQLVRHQHAGLVSQEAVDAPRREQSGDGSLAWERNWKQLDHEIVVDKLVHQQTGIAGHLHPKLLLSFISRIPFPGTIKLRTGGFFSRNYNREDRVREG